MEDQLTTKLRLIEAVVGSKEWVHAIQESILDVRSLCFVCGEQITFRLDFFYMRGRMGLVMFHDDCFDPFNRKPYPKSRTIEPNGTGELPPGEWLTIGEACRYVGIGYMAMYQRITAGMLASEKRDNKWFVSRRALEAMGPGKLTPGMKPGSQRLAQKTSKSRIWRSEVTESVDRIPAAEAARRIGVSRSWVLSRKDQFGAVKIDGAWHLSTKLVSDYIKNEEDHGFGIPPR